MATRTDSVAMSMGYALRVCGWCKKDMGRVGGANFVPDEQGNPPISHGLCPHCAFSHFGVKLPQTEPSHLAKQLAGDQVSGASGRRG